eukprot:gb/GECG01011460.1/.p1 GENE.gb/GECG01011460.1/~~gb/GECG01011460.1/.p1  ORF type:complete len:892 (+),score=112.02 gb/GECG01011460.1/:1-2676(+)
MGIVCLVNVARLCCKEGREGMDPATSEVAAASASSIPTSKTAPSEENEGSSEGWESGSSDSEENDDAMPPSLSLRQPKENFTTAEEEEDGISISFSRQDEEVDNSRSSSKSASKQKKTRTRKSKDEIELAKTVHRVHLLTLLCRQQWLSDASDDPLVQAAAMSYFCSKELLNAVSDGLKATHKSLPTIPLLKRIARSMSEKIRVVPAQFDYSSSTLGISRRLLRKARKLLDPSDVVLSRLQAHSTAEHLVGKLNSMRGQDRVYQEQEEDEVLYCSQEEASQLLAAITRGLGIRTRLICSHAPLPVHTTKKNEIQLDDDDNLSKLEYCDAHPVTLSRVKGLLQSVQPYVSVGSTSNGLKHLQSLGLPFIWLEVWGIDSSKAKKERWIPVEPCRCLIDVTGLVEALAAKKHFPAYVVSCEPAVGGFRSYTDTTPRYLSKWSHAHRVREHSGTTTWVMDTLSRLSARYEGPTVEASTSLKIADAGGFVNILTQWCEGVGIPFDQLLTNVAEGGGTFEARFAPSSDSREPRGQENFDHVKENEPLPTSLSDFSSHPTYCLPSQLKVDEAVDRSHAGKRAYIQGFFNGEPVYKRTSVVKLKSKEKWLKEEGRQIKHDQIDKPIRSLERTRRKPSNQASSSTPVSSASQPNLGQYNRGDRHYWTAYDRDISSKIASSKSGSKKLDKGNSNRDSQAMESESPKDTYTIPLYSYQQTEPFDPPQVEDGKIPRNKYGNVELLNRVCLPHGAEYLPDMPRRARSVIRKAGVDAVEAVTGFEYKRGEMVPVKEGIIVPAEMKDAALQAWNEHEQARISREEEKRLNAVYERWSKLVRAALVRHRLRSEYYGEKDKSEHYSKLNPNLQQSKMTERKRKKPERHSSASSDKRPRRSARQHDPST